MAIVSASDLQQVSYSEYSTAITAGLYGQELAFGLPPKLVKFVAELKDSVTCWVDKLHLKVADIIHAFLSKEVYQVLSKVGFKLGKLLIFLNKALSIVKTGLVKVFQKMEKEGWLDKLKAGTAKIDDLLNRFPILKKITGPVIAGLLFYIWLNMSFTGSFSITELLATPEGLATLTLLVTGFLTGGALSFHWLADSVRNLVLALVYTGAKKAKIPDLAKKTHEAIQHKLAIAHSVISTVGKMLTLLKSKQVNDNKIQKRLARLKVRRQSDLDSLQK